MHKSFRLGCAAAAAALAVSACVGVRTVDTEVASAIKDELAVGDRISVVTTGTQQYDLEIVELLEGEFVGVSRDEARVALRYDELTGLTVMDPQPARTALGISGLAAVSLGIAVNYPAYFLASVLLFRD